MSLKDALAAKGSQASLAREGAGPRRPDAWGGGGTEHVVSRRVVQSPQQSPPAVTCGARAALARYPYISVPGAGALPPTETCSRKRKVRSAADTHLRPAAASRGRRL